MSNTPLTTPLLTTSEAASLLGVHRATIWRWVQSGQLAPVMTTTGGLQLFAESDVVALVKADR